MGYLDTSALALQKAGFNTVKAIFDALYPAAVSTWTPTWTYDGTSFTIGNLYSNEYIEFGPLVWFSLFADFTLVGDGRDLTFSLPISNGGGNIAFPMSGASNSSTTMGGLARASVTSVICRRYDSTDWTAGVRSLGVGGVYWKG